MTLGRRRIATTAMTRTTSTLLAPKGFLRRRTPNLLRSRPAATSRSSSSSSSSLLGRAWERYTEALLARPLLVKGSAAAVIFFGSDAATQAITETDSDAVFDLTRAASGSAFGVAATIWLHYWWGFLEIVFNRHVPVGAYGQNKLINALGKVVADQLVGAPLYLYSYFCVTHFGTEWFGRRRDEKNLLLRDDDEAATTTEERRRTPTNDDDDDDDNDDFDLATSLARETSDRALGMLPDTLLRHWTLWPIVHTLNFYHNPIHHRVLVQNIVLIFWSGYLSHLNNGGLVSSKEESAEGEKTVGVDDDRDTAAAATPLATSSGRR